MISLSIIIPAYNACSSLPALLRSLVHSRGIKKKQVEVVVVDDHSADGTAAEVQFFFEQPAHQVFAGVRIVVLKRNAGPAKARNCGVQYACGSLILFLDADVVVYPDTLRQVLKSFEDDPDLFAMTGVWDKRQHSRAFFPRFKALRDWSYWIYERDPRNYYYLFSTRIAAIKRDLFLRLGGFDETYQAALVEDIDLTYRIARRYAVVFNPNVIVHHEFEPFWPIARKYFLRSYYWSKLYRKRKKFDPVATTWKEALTTVSAGIFILFSFLGYLGYLGNLGVWTIWTVCLSIFFLLLHLWGVRKFLWFCFREEGLWFAVRAFVMGMILYLIILAGAVFSWIK